jgi:hypothetical protein
MTRRAMMSAVEPAVNGTTTVIGLVGQAWNEAWDQAALVTKAANRQQASAPAAYREREVSDL